MGTNYYAKVDECGHCGRSDEIHIGKFSYMGSGRCSFTFKINDGYGLSVVELIWFLVDRGAVIVSGNSPDMTPQQFQNEILSIRDSSLDKWLLDEFS